MKTPAFCARTTLYPQLPVGQIAPDGAVGIAENRVSSDSAPRPTPDFPGRAGCP